MTKREKVIRGLEAHANPKTCETCAGEECPYYHMGGGYTRVTCSSILAADALALLKEQEPRVLEYSEIEKNPLVWLEDNGKEDVIPALFLQYNGWNVEFALQAPDEWVDMIVRSAKVVSVERTYGVTWRAWSSRPTEEQRKEAAWNYEEEPLESLEQLFRHRK